MLFAASVLLTSIALSKPQESNPFNERLVYKMSYMGLSSARAEFLLAENSDSAKPVIIFVAKVETRGISDAIFRIRNRYESHMDKKTGLPILAKKEIDQPNVKHSLEIVYDQTECLAKSNKAASWPIPPNCYDLFSMLYALRTVSFEDGDSVRFIIDAESQIWGMLGRVSNVRFLKTNLGRLSAKHFKFSFHTPVSVEPRKWKTDLLTNRIGKEGGLLEIWLSNDTDKLPLKMRFGKGFSAVEMTLIKCERF